MDAKKWYESKTIWLNVAAVLFLILQEVGAGDAGLDPELQAAVIAIVNLVLRYFFTDKPLEA
jgi:hypothetical protein